MTTATASQAYQVRSVSFTVPSHTTAGKSYTVTVDPADGLPVACTCPGYRFHGRCRHLGETKGLKPRVRLCPTGPVESAAQRAGRLATEAAAARRAYVEAARTAKGDDADLWA